MSGVGFLIWNPSRNLPTHVHETIESALAEFERLTRLHPGERFIIMSPVLAGSDASAAKAWSDGRAEGLAERLEDIKAAEAVSDRQGEELDGLRKLRPLLAELRQHQSTVADCLCWFDGFAGAFAHRDGWEQPRIPDRDAIRRLNGRLQDLLPEAAPDMDDEVPF